MSEVGLLIWILVLLCVFSVANITLLVYNMVYFSKTMRKMETKLSKKLPKLIPEKQEKEIKDGFEKLSLDIDNAWKTLPPNARRGVLQDFPEFQSHIQTNGIGSMVSSNALMDLIIPMLTTGTLDLTGAAGS